MRALILALLTVGLTAAPAAAQDQTNHEGFWIGFGLGGGSNLSTDASGARAGGAGYVRLGGTVNPMLLIGGEVIGWARTVEGSTVSQGNVTADVLFYPNRRGFYLKSGLGFATWSWTTSPGPNTTTRVTNGGFGATFGGGYDFQLGNNIYLTPNIDLLIQVVDSSIFTSNTGYLMLFTLGLTWH
jgi:hypothetical protein